MFSFSTGDPLNLLRYAASNLVKVTSKKTIMMGKKTEPWGALIALQNMFSDVMLINSKVDDFGLLLNNLEMGLSKYTVKSFCCHF